jgi:hypothetical protein
MCLPFPLAWMQGNEVATGDPFYPMTYIAEFHRSWVADGFGRYGQVGYRLHNLLFWPGAAFATLTPLVAVFAGLGMVRTFKESPEHRWLLWVIWVPTAVFAVKGAVLANFAPLARFAAAQLVLLFPFVERGFSGVLRGRGAAARWAWAGLAAAVAVALPVWLGGFTFHRDGVVESSLRPISPTSTNPVALMAVARALRREVAPTGEAAIIDSDPQYRDLQIAFFDGLPEKRMARYRWEDFPKLLASAAPRVLVRVEGGGIERDPEYAVLPGGVRFRGATYREVPGFTAPYHVYRRD